MPTASSSSRSRGGSSAEARRARIRLPAVDDIFQSEKDGRESEVLARFGCGEPPFLFVGNVEPKKDVSGLLEAYAALKRRFGTGRRLLLVGGRGWRSAAALGRIGALGLADDVVRAGYVPRRELPAIYRASVGLVFPSLCEGFGLPPLEAMACGTPVICTGGSGLAESVGAAARLVPTGEPEALAGAMHELEHSPDLRARLRRDGLARAQQFRWEGKAEQFVRLYERAVRELA